MTRRRVLGVAMLMLALAACGGGEDHAANTATAPNPSTASALEQAAIDAGVVAEADSLSPAGLYRRRHEAGLDSLCIVGGADGDAHFGLEAVFGRGIACRGQGRLDRSDDRLMLSFAGSSCRIEADYQGDGIVFPGTVDPSCDRLCTERGSLAGVSFPRVSRDESVARDARAQDRAKLCPKR